jgi:type III pantothenate kinase
MLLAVDVGNTNVKCAIFVGTSVKAHWKWPTDHSRRADDYTSLLHASLESHKVDADNITDVVIGSVIPSVTPHLDLATRTLFDCDPLVAAADNIRGMIIDYDPPTSLGIDRIADAVAAVDALGSPCIAVDMGTATTFNVVTRDTTEMPVFRGGAIAPGRAILTQLLAERTAQLPEIDLSPPKGVLARSSVEAMRSGSFFGYASMVDGMVERLRREIGDPTCPVIATGGAADSDLIRACVTIVETDPYLTLHGLRLIFDKRDV